MPIRFVGSDCTDIFRLRFRGCPSGKNSFKYQNSPTHFHLPLFLEFFGGNLTKVGQNYINNKFAQSGRIPPKIAKNSRHARRLSRLLKLQINRTMGPPGVNDDGNYMKDEPHHKRLPSNQRKIDVFGLWRLEVTLQSRSFAYQLEYVSIRALCGRSIFWFVFNSA